MYHCYIVETTRSMPDQYNRNTEVNDQLIGKTNSDQFAFRHVCKVR